MAAFMGTCLPKQHTFEGVFRVVYSPIERTVRQGTAPSPILGASEAVSERSFHDARSTPALLRPGSRPLPSRRSGLRRPRARASPETPLARGIILRVLHILTPVLEKLGAGMDPLG
jgi:hypothetical protein